MFVRVTLPQLVTTPLTRLPWPTTTLSQFLVTRMHGASVTMQTLVAEPDTRVPHMLLAEAVTMLVKLPHVLFVTSLL
jgi:hypothetical protein